MKKTILSIAIIFLFAIGLMAQTTTTNGSAKKLSGNNLFVWNVTLDSTETEYSQPFTIAGFDSRDSASVRYYAKLGTVTGGKGYATTVTIFYSFDLVNWTSVGANLASLTSASASTGENGLNDIVAPYYKIKAANTKATNTLTVSIYAAP